MNGTNAQAASSALATLAQSTQSSPGGFVAVNARPHHDQNGAGASQTTRHDLLTKFHTLSDRRASSQPTNGATDGRRPSMGPQPPSHPTTPLPGTSNKPPPKPAETGPSNLARPPPYSDSELQHMMNSPVPIPNTPSNLLPAASQRASQPQEKDDGGPFKAEMVHRMESLAKGERILPPCDRCRRLHMDCLKNLTACMGCTKKHAKCSWKEVREAELRGSFSHHVEARSGIHSEGEELDSRERASTGSPGAIASPPRQGMTPNSNHGTGAPPHPLPSEARYFQNRVSPPNIERDRDRGVEAQLQEAAKSSLAHANARLGAPEGKGAEYQTLVA